ncbi:hypothetical protein [Actibacterium pelagium]|uniref:Alpha/beta hydrolase family protein n=1 Tax=Actibacterium pelagium TaxID=2029103 RepID=A0A917ADD7_9RHOB|nr:hypothetical protein [Actibacterium pelagium]GGE43457.1 hypothetical protein GCM10011517_08880 [Actibacterium pelagium]
MAEKSDTTVLKRRVFYIPGYDPFPPRRYREIYRREGAAQAQIAGYELKMVNRQSGEGFGWSAELTEDGQTSTVEVEVLEWADIVQASMNAGVLATYGQLLVTTYRYLASGALFRLMRLRKGPVIAALYPVVLLLIQLILALLVARFAGAILAISGIPCVGWLGLAAVWPVLHLFRKWDNKLFAYYLMHDYAFSARWNGAYPKQLQDRLSSFRDRIEAALDEDIEEVLVIGHSSGAYLGVSVMAGLQTGQGPKVAYLSLGQVVPMVSFLPKATELRRGLRILSERNDIFWLDVSAPGDGCSFALCDPVAVSGVSTNKQRGPLVLSAAFTQTLSPERYKALRWRFFRLHFQYLCAFDNPEGYDYFQITAGAKTLEDRFADRTASASRIEAPRSGYRSVT